MPGVSIENERDDEAVVRMAASVLDPKCRRELADHAKRLRADQKAERR